MSILNGVVAMNLDSTGHGYEEPSTPLRDPASSPAIHIKWQNSQSACAALDELRVASSVPRHPPPKPLTFDFELPACASASAAAEPSSSTSDPFSASRTRARTRALGRVQSHSQNDVFVVPAAADASKFLDMLSRASARVDENSRRRLKRAREFELRNGRDRAARTQIASSPSSSIKGKGKGKGKAKERVVTRSMDELGDHTNLLQFRDDAARQFSSLPIMETKDPSLSRSQPGPTVQAGTNADEDVHMHVDDPGTDIGTLAPGNRRIKSPVSTTHAAKNRTRHHHPLRPSTTTHPQNRARAEAPSPTPRQPSGHLSSLTTTTAAAASQHHHRHHHQSHNRDDPHHSIRAPTPLPLPAATATAAAERSSKAKASKEGRGCPSAVVSASQLPPSSQAHGPKRALGMTRSSVPRSLSSSPHSAAVKKPFRPPLARAAPIAAHAQHEPSPAPQPQRRQEDRKTTGADPDSSFDISFDFDPEALEAAMRKFD